MSILDSTEINANRQPVVADFSTNSDTLFVTFGGVAAGLGIPPFEFFRTIAEIPTKRLLIRDLEQVWYHAGLPGVSNSIDGTAEYLHREIARGGVRRTVFVGNSMGGYAAILFGCLVGASVVHAFSPQTFVGKWHRLFVLERRWRADISRLHRLPGVNRRYLDLLPLVRNRQDQTQVHIHYAAKHRMDRYYAQRLAEFPCVTLHPHPVRDHNLVKYLRNAGTLQTTLRQTLDEQGPPRRAA